MTALYTKIKQLRVADVTVGCALCAGYALLLILTLWPQAFLV